MKFTLAAATSLFVASVAASASCPLKIFDAARGVDCIEKPGNLPRGQSAKVIASLTQRRNTVECSAQIGNDYWFGVRSANGPCYVSEGSLYDGENCRLRNNLPIC